MKRKEFSDGNTTRKRVVNADNKSAPKIAGEAWMSLLIQEREKLTADFKELKLRTLRSDEARAYLLKECIKDLKIIAEVSFSQII
jgi:hypothetical protein